jgi:hypothetical protein
MPSISNRITDRVQPYCPGGDGRIEGGDGGEGEGGFEVEGKSERWVPGSYVGCSDGAGVGDQFGTVAEHVCVEWDHGCVIRGVSRVLREGETRRTRREADVFRGRDQLEPGSPFKFLASLIVVSRRNSRVFCPLDVLLSIYRQSLIRGKMCGREGRT